MEFIKNWWFLIIAFGLSAFSIFRARKDGGAKAGFFVITAERQAGNNEFTGKAIFLFIWLPLIAVVLLSPGRNGSNLHAFGPFQLSLLLLCGLLFAVLPLSYFAQKCWQASISSAAESTSWEKFKTVIFALAMSALCFYLAVPELVQAW